MATNSGAKAFICVTPQPTDLLSAAFAALVYVEIKGVGDFSEIGVSSNMLTYDTWGDDVVRKEKGMSDAGSPTLEVLRIPTDPGQIAIRNAAKTKSNYAFKIVRNDGVTTGTTVYNRGLVAGPSRPQGRNEDFDLEVFTMGFQQLEVIVEPT